MNIRPYITLFLALVLSFFASCALAQEDTFYTDNQAGIKQVEAMTPKTEYGGFFSNMEGSVKVLKSAIGKDLGKGMLAAAQGIAVKLEGPALKLAGALMLVYLTYELLQFMSGANRSLTQVIFDVAIPCMFAALLIKNYQTKIADLEQMFDLFRNVGAEDGKNGVDQIFSVYQEAIGSVGTAFTTILKNHGSIAHILADGGALVALIIDAFACIGLLLVILFLIATGTAELAGIMLLGPFMHAIGIAFGPLLIAGLATPWTREFFKKWIIFLLISAAITGVLNVIFAIAKTLISADAFNIGAVAADHSSAVGLLLTVIMLLTLNSMIEQAPGITSALFPGHLGATKGTGGALKKAFSGAAMGGKNTIKSATKTFKGSKGKLNAKAGGAGTGATP